MKSLFVDTNIVIDLICGDTGIAKTLGAAEQVFVSTIVEGEFLTGIRRNAKSKKSHVAWERFLDLPTVKRISLSSETAAIYAHLVQALKDIGMPLPSNDIWIAAHTLEHGSILFTRDRHFARIKTLRTI